MSHKKGESARAQSPTKKVNFTEPEDRRREKDVKGSTLFMEDYIEGIPAVELPVLAPKFWEKKLTPSPVYSDSEAAS